VKKAGTETPGRSLSCEVLTLFPGMIEAYLGASIMGRAAGKGLLRWRVVDLRRYGVGRHRVTDDTPYGGGGGMVMKPEPFFRALDALRADGRPRRIIMPGPQGRRFDQRLAGELAAEDRCLTFLCGRYEGIDERVRLALVDDEISLGDYVLTGGELAALAIIDAAVRLVPGVLGDERSSACDSFSDGVFDCPHYTRPPVYRGYAVPEVLLSGDHARVARFRRKAALARTLRERPDLLADAPLSDLDRQLIEELKKEEDP